MSPTRASDRGPLVDRLVPPPAVAQQYAVIFGRANGHRQNHHLLVTTTFVVQAQSVNGWPGDDL